MTDRSRAWCFTVNNYNANDEILFQNLDCRYMVFGRESGDKEATPHLQGYLCLGEAKTLGGVKKIHKTAHWEIARGSPEQNRTYCIKQGLFEERGVIPMNQKRKGESNAERWSDAKKAAIEGRLEDIPADIFVQYYRTVKEIKKDYMSKPDDLTDIENYWICGPPGSGKSRSARERYPGSYFKLCNKWWDGYQGEENVIIDDWELDHKVLGHHLKIWADRYSFLAETKGGAIHIRPKRIIVTSNYPIESVFEDNMMCSAINRRFTVESSFPAMTIFK